MRANFWRGRACRCFWGLVFGLLVSPAWAVVSPQFAAPVSYNLGTNCDQICTGDFNGDGKPDLALLCVNAKKLIIVTNNGSGGFAVCTNYTYANTAHTIASGDFNGDGKADVAMVTYPGDSLTVWLGNGKGLFPTVCVTSFTVNYSFPGIALGDFNNDGKLDAIVATYGPQVLLGRGDGYFDFHTNYYIGSSYAAVVGNFNSDTNLDFAISDYSSSSMSVFIGTGDGFFPVHTNYSGANSEYHYSVAAGDFNNDGWLDLATVNFYANSVSIRTNNGDGTFGAQTNFSAWASQPESIAVGDFNGDGNLDILTANYAANAQKGVLSILSGDGHAWFDRAVTNFVGVGKVPANQSICVADFNGDGRPDIATTLQATNGITVLLNQSLPILNASPLGNGLKIAGPNWLGYVLESSTDMTAAGSWTTVTNDWLVQGCQRFITNQPAGEAIFYRLRR